MAADELIDFEVIEASKENIQPLREGRSAKALASILSPVPSAGSSKPPTFDETRTLNDAIRAEYEIELQSIADSDDPLDIYDRYVKWTLNAYPSAQATPQSQLLPLLERATKAFLTSSHYKNDPRYLKLWLQYIRLFSDAPRETFAFLAQHRIGETLGLYYEEFAAWLESAGRWNQAEEVYKLGIEKQARPVERLIRKYSQFQQRLDARPNRSNEPSSPALPKVRPALAAKIDPFAPAAAPASTENPQQQALSGRVAATRSGKPKMAIFSDANEASPVPPQSLSSGWDSIDSLQERKKENTIEARPWTGETLKAGGRIGSGPKMEVFKDPSRMNHLHKTPKAAASEILNPRTGRAERVFVNMSAIYPNDKDEFSFEELRAMNRGWTQRDWSLQARTSIPPNSAYERRSPIQRISSGSANIEALRESFQQTLSLAETSSQSLVGMPAPKTKSKRMKVREVKQEAQTIKARLESPTGPKIKRRGSAEPTMTFHSRAANDEIYDIFNQPGKKLRKEDTQSGEESDYDDTYSTAGESTGTGRISAATSDIGDDTLAWIIAGREDNTGTQPDSVSPWSDFTTSKHIPLHHKKKKSKAPSGDDLTEGISSSQNQTQTSGLDAAFDTQAIAAIANQNFDDMDTKAIALIAGADIDATRNVDEPQEDEPATEELEQANEPLQPKQLETQHELRYIPLPPEDYEPTPLRTYRDPAAVAQNKLPFMTPIAEQTESSIAPSTLWKDADYFSSKTPSRPAKCRTDSPSKLELEGLLMSSPGRDSSPQLAAKRRLRLSGVIEEEIHTTSPRKRMVPLLVDQHDERPPMCSLPLTTNEAVQIEKMGSVSKTVPPKAVSEPVTKHLPTGPVINDLQCNPCDQSVRKQIISAIQPPISSYEGYSEHRSEAFARSAILKSYTDKLPKQKSGKFSPRKSASDKTRPVPPVLTFKHSRRSYAVTRELGKGAFAPVYLVESHAHDSDDFNVSTTPAGSPTKPSSTLPLNSRSRSSLEALKSESPPHTLVWEFHILRLVRCRLPPASRALASIINAHECHLYRDEAYLVLSYSPQGTILDLVNLFRASNVAAGKQVEGTGLDEALVMFFAVELLRTVQALHSIGLLHGDLKADNCLVRLDTSFDLTAPYSVTGKEGWSSKGLTLIDFGRGIDTTMFQPRAKFVADWEPHAEECVEIRECKPWKWQIDFYGAAGVIHSMLFGKYLETIPVTPLSVNDAGEHTIKIGAQAKKEYKPREPFKRYWEKDLWTDVFHVLLNKGSDEDDDVIESEIVRIRRLMETWLETEGERRDLRNILKRAERMVKGGK